MINLGKIQLNIIHKWRTVLISMKALTRSSGDNKGYDLLQTLNQEYPTANDLDTVNAIYYHNKDFDYILKVRSQIESLNRIKEEYKGII